jgi:formylmethanofuran dehydrogenase subunit E
MTMLPAILVSTLMIMADPPTESARVSECLDRVRAIHGAAGPWAVAGYRIGERAMKDLKLPRPSFTLKVVHRCPAQVQCSCMANGLQAATGASPGKLNLKIEEVPADQLSTAIEDRKTGRRLTFTIQPAFVQLIRDLPVDKLEQAGRRVAGLPEEAIFQVKESRVKED